VPDREAPLVLLACPGLDHAHRGFETFARECFEALRGRDDLRIELVKGSGPAAAQEAAVPTLLRDSAAARLLGRGRLRQPYVVEHLSFAASLLPRLTMRPPDVVYFSEWHVGRALAAWRRASRRRFALAFCNGALVPGGYAHLERVQQLVPGAMEHALARGEDPARQLVLPLGVAIERAPAQLLDSDRAALRSRLGLPADRRVVLSAGAINQQKRVGFLIEEVAALPQPRPFLLLLGQEEAGSAAIRRLASERLGPGGHAIRTVAPRQMADHYRAADAFVLASLWESFGRVLVEAQSHGLPCLAHEHPVMRWVLGEEGDTADLSRPGGVAAWLQGPRAADLTGAARRRRHRSAYLRFSWSMLADRYAEMLRGVAQETRRGAAARGQRGERGHRHEGDDAGGSAG
jgi:1,2-diacylglycerol 3-alpha-glucosyltransferase